MAGDRKGRREKRRRRKKNPIKFRKNNTKL